MPGPKKESNAHKKAKGSRKVHAGQDVAPELLKTPPKSPAFLKGKKYAIQEWNRVCKLLVAEEILTRWDLQTIKTMCNEWERYCIACEHIEANGEYFITTTGYEQVRPASGVRNQAFTNYTKLLRLVGGDVEARAKMKRVKPQKAEDDGGFGSL